MRRPKSRKETDKSSPYFRAGAIALVFIVIGYQTALFVNRAAILRIEALRDRPDTVYIYQGLPPKAQTGMIHMPRLKGPIRKAGMNQGPLGKDRKSDGKHSTARLFRR